MALLLLIALVLVIASFSHRKHRSVVLLLAGLLLLSPEYSATWVGGTTQYYALILFSLLSLKWLYHIEKPRYLFGSIGALFLAIYSMIGGVLVPLVGLGYLLVSRKITKPSGLIWVASSLVFLIGYFSTYESHQNQPSVWFFLQEPRFTFEFTFRMLSNLHIDNLRKSNVRVEYSAEQERLYTESTGVPFDHVEQLIVREAFSKLTREHR